MSKRKRPKREPTLFDLPLHANDEESAGGPSELDGAGDLRIGSAAQETGPRGNGDERDETHAETAMEERPDGEPDAAPEPPAPLRDRLLAGLLDLGIQLLVAGGAFGAVQAMGVSAELVDWPPFAILALIFSFLYWFIPLAFWGQTPGMAWVGNSAVGLTDEPLTFTQTVLRWIGAVMTLALAGLPLLLVLGGRSLSDRLSDSKTIVI